MTDLTNDMLTGSTTVSSPRSGSQGEDELGAYFREIRQYPRLTPQEERELAMRCAAGDQGAVRRMVQCNLRLVMAVAREYSGRGVPLMDLIQEGNIGLIVAARKFDYTRELRFSTYATKWIRQGITRCLMNHAGLIRVPVHTAERMRAILAARSAYVQANGREPDLNQLAEAVNLPPEKVAKLLSLVPEISSLDAPAGDGDGTVGQLLPDQASGEPQEILVQAQLLQAIMELMAQLTDRQQQILRMHYGLDDGVCHSLEDIAGHLGISKERVRQVEKQAFEKMKALGASMGLEEYLEG